VEYRRFGVALEFTPTVLSNETISIRVKPEVSEITPQGGITVGGFSVPSLSTRRAETTVDLAIGGLLRSTTSRNAQLFPGLGDLPVLGALFRSDNFRRDETELVIIVTPYLVRGAPTPYRMRTPIEAAIPAATPPAPMSTAVGYNPVATPASPPVVANTHVPSAQRGITAAPASKRAPSFEGFSFRTDRGTERD
jgi:pilus assembly protein CpaC